MEAFWMGAGLGLWGFFGTLKFPSILFYLILAGITVSYLLTKKGIGECVWRWRVLFGAELVGILWAIFASQWGEKWELLGWGDVLIPRVAVVLYSLQLIVTLLLWLRLRKERV